MSVPWSDIRVSTECVGVSPWGRRVYRGVHGRLGDVAFEEVVSARVRVDPDEYKMIEGRALSSAQSLPRHRNVLPVIGVTPPPRVGIVRGWFAVHVGSRLADVAADRGTWTLLEQAAGFARGLAELRGDLSRDDESSWMPLPFCLNACVLGADGTPMVIEAATTDPGRRCVVSEFVGNAPSACWRYSSPAVIRQRHWSQQEDVWSLGVVLCELAGGSVAFGELDDVHVCTRVAYEALTPDLPPAMPPSMRAVVQQCFASDGDARPTLAAVAEQLECVRDRGRVFARMLTVCVALEWLELPAFVTLQIVEDDAAPGAHVVPLHVKWSIVTVVKHLVPNAEKWRRRQQW